MEVEQLPGGVSYDHVPVVALVGDHGLVRYGGVQSVPVGGIAGQRALHRLTGRQLCLYCWLIDGLFNSNSLIKEKKQLNY